MGSLAAKMNPGALVVKNDSILRKTLSRVELSYPQGQLCSRKIGHRLLKSRLNWVSLTLKKYGRLRECAAATSKDSRTLLLRTNER